MKDTTPTISEKIETMVRRWFGEPVLAVEDELKQLLADFAEHITPENITDYTGTSMEDFQRGHNSCISLITKRTKEYLDV